MPHRSRAPQNSASSTHSRAFSDLQNFYQKIIHTSGVSFPFRSKDSRRQLHTAPAYPGVRHTINASLADSEESVNRPAVSAAKPVEEIVIKPLQFHDREPYWYRRYSSATPSSACRNTQSLDTRYNNTCSLSSSNSELCRKQEVRLVRFRPKSSIAMYPVEYSDQSIRYVAEQVSLAKARQLKLRTNTTQHRVDRKYFVSGSKLCIQRPVLVDGRADFVNGERVIVIGPENDGKNNRNGNNNKLAPVNGKHLTGRPEKGLKQSPSIHSNSNSDSSQKGYDRNNPLTGTLSAVAIPTAPPLSAPAAVAPAAVAIPTASINDGERLPEEISTDYTVN